MMFSCHSSGNGTDQSDAPRAASTPTIDALVIVTIWRVPPAVIAIGEA
jgi:hypothetical protein